MEWIPVLVVAVLVLIVIVRNIYVVQQSRDLRAVDVRAVFLRQLHRRRRRAEHMGAALGLEIAQRDGAELLYR